MRHAFALTFLLAGYGHLAAADWLTLPGQYSHDPVNGRRVEQYAAVDAPVAPIDRSFRSSGYTHTRSTLAFGQSADNYHRVEAWGDPVRPYGEWRFPFRPYSAPYPAWGPPYGGLNIGGFDDGLYGRRYRPIGYGEGPYDEEPYGDEDPYEEGPYNDVDPDNGYDEDGPDDGYRFRRPYYRPRTLPVNPLSPYPAGPGTPYPVAPYYDGYYPSYRD